MITGVRRLTRMRSSRTPVAPRPIETYLVGDCVYTLDPGLGQSQASVSGRFTDYVRPYVMRGLAAASRDGLLNDALQRIDHLAELRFCLLELVPQLCAMSSGKQSLMPDRTYVGQLLDQVERGARPLRDLTDVLTAPGFPNYVLQRWFGVPCAIAGKIVVPLEPGPPDGTARVNVLVNGMPYRWRLDAALSLSEHIQGFEQSVALHVQARTTQDQALLSATTELLGSIDVILKLCQRKRSGACDVVYQDAEYQLQHNRGRWLLVRGPVPMRIGGGSIWVALEVKGSTRQLLLNAVPGATRDLCTLWTPQGTPSINHICLGHPGQYAHLSSPNLSDAQALLRRLDVGVILATQRSTLHCMLRHEACRKPGSGRPRETSQDVRRTAWRTGSRV